MRLFYDGVIFTRQLHGGISRMYDQLRSEILEIAPTIDIRCFRFPSELTAHPVIRRTHYQIGKVGGLLRRLDKYVFLPRAVRSFNPDIYHTSYFRLPRNIDSDVASVVTVYDMIHERFPEQFDSEGEFSAIKHDCVERADHVIVISECTKQDLIEYFDVPAEKITVTYLAASPHFQPADQDTVASIRNQYDIGSQFLLYVGRRSGYKNFMTLLRAYADWDYRDNIPLVCVGGNEEWNEKEATLINSAELTNSVRLLGRVEDQQLRALYTTATAFVYPSQYEGFGIPPLEAMQCGTPVIVSEVSSIPEVVGDAGIYIDPGDISDIQSALTTVVTDNTRREALVEAGFERAEKFNWNRTARQTYDVYEQLL